jgi:hypothetical protein
MNFVQDFFVHFYMLTYFVDARNSIRYEITLCIAYVHSCLVGCCKHFGLIGALPVCFENIPKQTM